MSVEFKSSKEADTALAIDYSDGLLSMAKSMKNLEEYAESVKTAVRQKTIAEIAEKVKSLESTEKVIEGLNSKRKWHIVRNVIEICNVVKWRFDVQSINPIACTEKRLLKKFNNKASVANQIKNAIKLNALICCSRYSNSIEGIAKEYWFNKEVFDSIVDIYFKNVSDDELAEELVKEDVEDEIDIDDSAEIKDEERIRLSSYINMNIDGVSDARIIEILNRRYPMYLEGKKIAEKLNQKLCDTEKIKWDWSITKQKRGGHVYLMKIGFRASNSMCNYKEHENENPFYQGVWRKDYLREKFGEDYGEYDVNGSIWRLSYNLSHDELLPFDVDVYDEFWKRGGFDGKGFKNKEERDLFKYISMRLYFGKEDSMGKNFVYTYGQMLKDLGEKGVLRDDDISISQMYFECVKDGGGRWLGQYFGSEIFLHESYLYIKMLDSMMNEDCDNVVQVYDGFYFRNSSEFSSEYLNKLYSSCILDYKNRYSDYFSSLFNSIYMGKTKKSREEKASSRRKLNKGMRSKKVKV